MQVGLLAAGLGWVPASAQAALAPEVSPEEVEPPTLLQGTSIDYPEAARELRPPPSGRVSVEHVQNVLARLASPARPADVVTTLKTAMAPLADTARYDRLRSICTQEERHA